MIVTFTRLPGGEWGIRVAGVGAAEMGGREVDVAKRGGATCRQRLGVLVSAAGGAAVYRKDPRLDCGRRWSA
jgi:hypothetical protein